MASTENQQHTFPAVPPSHSAGDHEMRDYYAPHDAPRPYVNQTPYLTPYLGLRARLSQVWINRWTILLLLVLVRTLIAIAGIDDNLSAARDKALRACTEVEGIGSTMASGPHFMAQGINEMTASGVEHAVAGLMSMLTLSVTSVEEIVLFVINMMTSTYVCLITLAVSGSLHAAVELGDEFTSFLNKTLPSLGDEIGNVTSSFESSFQTFLGKLSSLPFAGGSPPTINLDDEIKQLKDFTTTVPTDVSDGLQKLNDSIPTFADVKNFTDNLIRTPFEEVKKLINESMSTFEFNRALLPVPEKAKLSFCTGSNGINAFFDDLVQLENKARKIFIAVLVVLAILVCIPMAYREIRRYRWMQERSRRLVTQDGYEPMDVVYLTSRPYTSTWGMKLASRFGSTRRQTLMRWSIAYATSMPALFILSLGVAGLFACLCQFILLRTIQKEVPGLTNQVADFADTVIHSLNNASSSWAGGVNGAIAHTSDGINKDVFTWVNMSTTAVNDTLNGFVDQMHDSLDKTFGNDTALSDAITGVLDCLVTLKVTGIQKALTWVSDNAVVNFPTMNNDTFTLGALAQLSNSSTAAELLADPSSSTKDDISEAITSLTNKLEAGIRTEAIIAGFIILLWFLIALGGFIRALVLIFSHPKTHGQHGSAYTIDPAIDNAKVQDFPRPDTAAPPSYEYPVNKSAPYTIQPRPFPTFEPAQGQPTSNEEKVGQVGSRNVGDSVARPNHLRASSHGHLGGNSPYDEKNPNNPFAD